MKLNDNCIDALKEVVNIGVGHVAASLNTLLQSHIELQVPEIVIVDSKNIPSIKLIENSEKVSCVRLDFNGELNGTGSLLFPHESALKLVSSITGEKAETPELDTLMSGVLNEVGNIVINGVIGSISNILDKPMDFSIPEFVQGNLEDIIAFKGIRPSDAKDYKALLVKTLFYIKELKIAGSILLIFEIISFEKLTLALEKISS